MPTPCIYTVLCSHSLACNLSRKCMNFAIFIFFNIFLLNKIKSHDINKRSILLTFQLIPIMGCLYKCVEGCVAKHNAYNVILCELFFRDFYLILHTMIIPHLHEKLYSAKMATTKIQILIRR